MKNQLLCVNDNFLNQNQRFTLRTVWEIKISVTISHIYTMFGAYFPSKMLSYTIPVGLHNTTAPIRA